MLVLYLINRRNIKEIERMSPGWFKEYPDVHWRGIMGMRDRIAHGYHRIQHEIIWNFIAEELPGMKEVCEQVLYRMKS